MPESALQKLAKRARRLAAKEDRAIRTSDLVRKAIAEMYKIDVTVPPPGKPKGRRKRR